MTTDIKKTAESDTVSISTDLTTPVSCIYCQKESCYRLCCSYNSYWKLLVKMFVILLYILLGGILFNLLERPRELQDIEDTQNARKQAFDDFVQFLVNSTNVTQEIAVNLTATLVEVARYVIKTVPAELDPIWDYPSAVFFCSNIVTSIGYGSLAPTTTYGRMVSVIYIVIGIPLALSFLNLIGVIIGAWVQRTLRPIKRRWGPTTSRIAGTILLFLIALIFFIIVPGIIFNAIEGWHIRDSIYYTSITLTTVGFGDFVPAETGVVKDSPYRGLYKLMTAVWQWVGLAVVAALVIDFQKLVQVSMEWFYNKCHFTKCQSKLQEELIEVENDNALSINDADSSL